jgi:hypothetical protein
LSEDSIGAVAKFVDIGGSDPIAGPAEELPGNLDKPGALDGVLELRHVGDDGSNAIPPGDVGE